MSDIVYVEKNPISCEGSGISGGHPRVFLNLGSLRHAVCPYCSREFILKTPSTIA